MLKVTTLRAAVLGWTMAVATLPAFATQTNAPPPPQPTAVKIETVAKGLEHPWGLQFLPGGRLLVTERPGRLRVVDSFGKVWPPVSGVPQVLAEGQGGLLDVALAPDFQDTSEIYLSFSEPRGGGKSSTSLARGKLVMMREAAALHNVQVVFRQEPAVASGFHFGSRIVFAPDGTLFLTTGDRGSQRKEAQNPGSHIGKVLHLNRDGTPAASNPRLPGWAAEVYSLGHRNIQGATLEAATGRLWTVEHGARGGDELNGPEGGKNYGWPVITYGRDYSGLSIGEGTAKAGLEQPVYYWDPSIATSGLAVHNGRMFHSWQGSLLVGGLAGAQLQRLVLKDGAVIHAEVLLSDRGQRIRDVRVADDGAVYLLTDDRQGEILRLTPQR